MLRRHVPSYIYNKVKTLTMFRIKKLDIFIAKQFGLLFIGTFFICQFVLMMQFLWKYVDELIGKGLSVDVLAEFFWYMALIMVPQALPLAILLSSLITYGNLGESSELTAIKAAGISLLQSMRGLIRRNFQALAANIERLPDDVQHRAKLILTAEKEIIACRCHCVRGKLA